MKKKFIKQFFIDFYLQGTIAINYLIIINNYNYLTLKNIYNYSKLFKKKKKKTVIYYKHFRAFFVIFFRRL